MSKMSEGQKALLHESIHILSLSTKVIKILEQNGVITILHLLNCGKEDILAMQGLGQKSLDQIVESLAKIGFTAK